MLMEPVNALARSWPCACLKHISRWRRLETTLNFLSCRHVLDLLLKYVSEINERYWLQLLFYFNSLMGIVASVVGMSFFSCVSGFRLMFFWYFTFTETFANRFQMWLDHEWIDFGVFYCEMASFVDFLSVWTKICRICSNVFLFWPHQTFSMFSLRGILVCFSTMLVLFSHRILQYRLISFRVAM